MFKRHVAKALLLATVTLFSSTGFSYGSPFPTNPNPELTPGKLCDQPVAYRYPEQIAYCERDVSSDTKYSVIQKYDEELGYKIELMNRSEFKIDHFIPLCAGGSNNVDNLWPQHRSVYRVTDPIEPILCEKMAQGKLRQADAINLIVKVKTNLKQAPMVLKTLQGL